MCFEDHSVDESHIDPKESGEESENPQAEVPGYM